MSGPGVTPLHSLTHRVRWRIFAFLFAFGFIAYVQQKGLTVAAQQMMPALQLSQKQIGWLEWAFVLGYATCQFPGGVLGQALGARRTFFIIGLLAFAGTILTPLAPVALGGTALYATLLLLQLVVQCFRAVRRIVIRRYGFELQNAAVVHRDARHTTRSDCR